MSEEDNTENNTNDTTNTTTTNIVEIITHKYNLLKNKAGARTNMKDNGYIEDKKIQAADKLIAGLCENSDKKIEEQITILLELWQEIQQMPENNERKEKTNNIFIISHEIKDIASLCGFNLIAHFAESLRDYIAETKMNMKNQRIIIQAHIDAMNTSLKTGISDHNHPIAEELKQKVKIAIEKYH